MFRLQDKDTGLWYKAMDEDGDIIWTEYKNRALIFPPEKREFWEDNEGVEIVRLLMDTTKERPILFSTEMVEAILSGRKTQTRRVIKPQPLWRGSYWSYGDDIFVTSEMMQSHLFHNVYGSKGSPYGAVYADGAADSLWVRESWAAIGWAAKLKISEMNRLFQENIVYKADGDKTVYHDWRPSIHMPQWASRLTLKITDVRVERLQGISESDAEAEGRPEWTQRVKSAPLVPNAEFHDMTAVEWFSALWDSINLKRGYSWKSNPWVWVVAFERVSNER